MPAFDWRGWKGRGYDWSVAFGFWFGFGLRRDGDGMGWYGMAWWDDMYIWAPLSCGMSLSENFVAC